MCEESNYGERVLLKGGYWDDNTHSGLFEPSVDSMREFSCPYMGFRAYGERQCIHNNTYNSKNGSGVFVMDCVTNRGYTSIGFRAS